MFKIFTFLFSTLVFGIVLQNDLVARLDPQQQLEMAEKRLINGEEFLKVKKYREARTEFKKASENLVGLGKEGDWLSRRIQQISKISDFHLLLEDVQENLNQALISWKEGDFAKAQSLVNQATVFLDRAAWIRPSDSEVIRLGTALEKMNDELQITFTNTSPIWNFYQKHLIERKAHSFYLESFEVNLSQINNHQVLFNLRYLSQPQSIYIIRYQIFFDKGQNFFNGHFLMSKDITHEAGQSRTMSIIQELPKTMWGIPVKRIEFKIFNKEDQIVSRVIRAFSQIDREALSATDIVTDHR